MWRNSQAETGRSRRNASASAPAVSERSVSATIVSAPGERASDFGVLLFSAFAAAVAFALACAVGWALAGSFTFPVAACSVLAAVLIVMAVHISQQWERVVVQRFGRFSRVAGPGLFFTIPIIEQTPIRIDCRTRFTAFGAEETLTADLVPLDVDAVMLWMVHDAKAACNEVSDFSATVELAAQAALRDAIGRLTAAEVVIRREQMDVDIQQILEDEASQWGISILSVKIRNILLPQALQDVMSLEAQAEQRRKARIILMEAEQDISTMIEGVGEAYGGGDAALRLRQMHLMYESVRETGGTVVVPSSFSEGFVEGTSEQQAAAN
ncbi:slipin family protein [Xiamenia xianingshaonis]|uniref:Slipin family protein n=1 Tax=Xiamenia xianingshaonis TaxID=2682776 RepID=A0A9E6MPL4_9ACTN|nr:slipin family protein [Xiamenia xianingshaonis]NHM14708.1 slipin family protein [Xiamenia xianingshaonis]QTU83758.1 slipin family protein [Xiamenia xianingshaonis]